MPPDKSTVDGPTLAAHIRSGGAAHDGCPLVFVSADGERETSLGALVSEAELVAGALQARGIGRGDVVAVQLPGSYKGRSSRWRWPCAVRSCCRS